MNLNANSLRALAGVCLGTTGLILGGCATASSPSAMIAAPATEVATHSGAVAIQVTGGSETSALGASKISNADFADAITASVVQSKLFEKVAAPGSPSDYTIEASIVRLDQPLLGVSFTVHLEVTWRLKASGDGKVIWEKAITSSYTAGMGDAFAGVKRLRLANEGAARENIKSAIAEMSALSFR